MYVVDEYGNQLYESYTELVDDSAYENNLIKALVIGMKRLKNIDLIRKCILCI